MASHPPRSGAPGATPLVATALSLLAVLFLMVWPTHDVKLNAPVAVAARPSTGIAARPASPLVRPNGLSIGAHNAPRSLNDQNPLGARLLTDPLGRRFVAFTTFTAASTAFFYGLFCQVSRRREAYAIMASAGEGLEDSVRAKLDKLINGSRILLFMKGTRFYPQCGFSRTAVQLLDSLQVPYETVDVLADPEIREGVKLYSQWPTIPQLYVNGEFIGGCDIMVEMYQSTELQELIAVRPQEPLPEHPSILRGMAVPLYLWPPSSFLAVPLKEYSPITSHEDLISHWDRSTVPAGDEMLVIHGDPPTLAVGSTLAYALYRRQIPTLLLLRKGGSHVQPPSFPSELMTVATYSTEAEAVGAAREFLRFPDISGRLFVFEGGDGSGKQTQSALLVARLQAEGYPVRTLDFPHDRALYGPLIREVLSGKFGSISDVNPLLFASLYAFNRLDASPRLRYWLKRGCNVVLDRYSSANWGHQASKYDSDEERLAVIETLRKFEHEWLGLPPAFRVLYLDLPPDFALRALQADHTRAALDIHETAGASYKNRVRSTFLWCCQTFPTWTAVPCLSADGTERLTRQDLHEAIVDDLRPLLVNGPLSPTGANPA
jgi:dTMP kinase